MDRRFRLPADGHLGDARYLCDLRSEKIFDVIVHRVQRERVGLSAEKKDRRVGRIDLPVKRRNGEVLGQLPAGGGDRRLDILSQIKLNHDLGRTQRAHRRHLRDAGDLPELGLQRHRDRGRHRLGAGARERRGDLDGWKIDLRKRGDRQERIGA